METTIDKQKLLSKMQSEGNQSVFLYKGYVCFCNRIIPVYTSTTVYSQNMFHWCGYIGIPKGHPFYSKGYNDLNVVCHGGLTFAGFFDNDRADKDRLFFIGFDCAHSGDICSFSTMFNNTDVYRDLQYVKNQCRKIVDQISDTDNLIVEAI